MTSIASTQSPVDDVPRNIPPATFELLAILIVLAAASLAFVIGWLSVDIATVMSTLLLIALVALSWRHLGQGRHPCFLFLCMLTLFQGGRLIAFCLRSEPNPLQVELMGSYSFALPRDVEGLTLLCVVLSAFCVYALCRWNYKQIVPPDCSQFRRYLPYLYLLFFASLPVQILKNYHYYEYAQQHGGYLFLYYNRTALQASFPLALRLLSQITLPAFVAIFVLEDLRRWRYLVTLLYFSTASIILFLGQRSSFFLLAAALWYVARLKSAKGSRLYMFAILALAGMFSAGLIQSLRERSDEWTASESVVSIPLEFVRLQGASLGVTEVAIQYRRHFYKYGADYLIHELQNAFVPSDAKLYVRGALVSLDVSAFLNPVNFDLGIGTGGSYIAEAYILAGVPGVILVSLLVGSGLVLLYRLSGKAMSLILMALTLSDFMWLPRGELLNWASALIRNLVILFVIFLGWRLYDFITSTIKHDSTTGSVRPA